MGNSETRPTLLFPDIPGFTKKGIQTTVTTPENGDRKGADQLITQSYQARAAGRFMLAPFTIMVNDQLLRSEGAVLRVRASATVSAPATASVSGPAAPTTAGAAFLTVRTSKHTVYSGEGVGVTLSFFVADTYPYVLDFTALNRQLQSITKKLRPANAWEQNRPIAELKPVPVLIGGRTYREIQLYQSVFYPLAARPLILPAVTLRLSRPRPNIGPPSSEVETVAFSSKPVTVVVRALPPHPLRGQVAVGTFRLTERLDQQRVQVGQSIRYGFTIAGEGNIAMLPAPATLAKTTELDVFPPEERHSINHDSDNRVNGRKVFTYFIIPRQNGTVPLSGYFRWIYFDSQRARYDTLRPQLLIRVGKDDAVAVAKTSAPGGTSTLSADTASIPVLGRSLYAGIKALDSTHQSISIPVLVRAVANVLIVLMLLGMIFVFFKK